MEPIGICPCQRAVDKCGNRRTSGRWQQAGPMLTRPYSSHRSSSNTSVALGQWAVTWALHRKSTSSFSWGSSLGVPLFPTLSNWGRSSSNGSRVLRKDPQGPLHGKIARTPLILFCTLMLVQDRLRRGSPLSVGAGWRLVPGNLQAWAACCLEAQSHGPAMQHVPAGSLGDPSLLPWTGSGQFPSRSPAYRHSPGFAFCSCL